MNYWWANAEDKSWDWVKSQRVGDIEEWEAKTDKGRIKKYFRIAQKDDIVVGYNSGNEKSIVALGIIEEGLHKNSRGIDVISIRKIKELRNSITIDYLRRISPFDKKFAKDISLRGTFIKLEGEEYNIIMSLIKGEVSPDFNIEFADIVEILGAHEVNISEEPSPIPRPISITSNHWEKNPKISKGALVKANYLCELDNSHLAFISEITGHNFVEAHHLVPMKEQKNYSNSLDVLGNIVSLCPNCHKLLHFGEMDLRREKLKMLYQKRNDVLKKYGIEISEKELLLIYE